MFRFSLAALLLVVSFTAVGCASLIYANEMWRQVIVTLTVVALLTATLIAVVQHDRVRAFAVGFAIVGWVYLILAFTPLVDVRDHLLTTRSLNLLGKAIGQITLNDFDAYVLDLSTVGSGQPYLPGVYTATTSSGQFRLMSRPQPALQSDFFVIGHSLWTLLLAVIGGLLGRGLSNRMNKSKH